MIEKPTIIITSLGRTATQFFAQMFAEIIPGSTSLHEPDYLNIGQYGVNRRLPAELARQLKESGITNLVLRKALGGWSLLKLSDGRLRGRLSFSDAVALMLKQRGNFIRSRKGQVYVESSSAYYGLIDVSNEVFMNHRIAYLVRDGRAWVRSKMNWRDHTYNLGRIRGLVTRAWPAPSQLDNDPFATSWDKMTRFEKLCWAWTRLNSYALGTIPANRSARLFRFEELFHHEDRTDRFGELVRFLASASGDVMPEADTLSVWLVRRIHQSEGAFPSWNQWPSEQQRQFDAICGPLMEELRYYGA